jgi:hypothetical protein
MLSFIHGDYGAILWIGLRSTKRERRRLLLQSWHIYGMVRGIWGLMPFLFLLGISDITNQGHQSHGSILLMLLSQNLHLSAVALVPLRATALALNRLWLSLRLDAGSVLQTPTVSVWKRHSRVPQRYL